MQLDAEAGPPEYVISPTLKEPVNPGIKISQYEDGQNKGSQFT
jgi:hypothetical protein